MLRGQDIRVLVGGVSLVGETGFSLQMEREVEDVVAVAGSDEDDGWGRSTAGRMEWRVDVDGLWNSALDYIGSVGERKAVALRVGSGSANIASGEGVMTGLDVQGAKGGLAKVGLSIIGDGELS